MVRVRRINNGFIGLNGFLGASSRGCTCLRSALPLARARSAPTEHMNAVCLVGAAETAAPPDVCSKSVIRVSSACSVEADFCTLKISQKNFVTLRQTPCKYCTSECSEKVHYREMEGVF